MFSRVTASLPVADGACFPSPLPTHEAWVHSLPMMYLSSSPTEEGGLLQSLMAKPQPEVLLAELAVTSLIAAAYYLHQQRPRGWARRDLVEVRKSPIAGMGLFAKQRIPSRTVIGGYPGVLRTPTDMANKALAAPGAKQYAFVTSSGMYLDPTDEQGLGPSARPGPSLPWPFKIQADMAYANEPPPGSKGTTCFVEDGRDETELVFVANRDIEAGEELYIDYGSTYDRSGYV